MTFHVYDGDAWFKCATLAEAEAACQEAIAAALDVCRFDCEWPDWVENICAHEGPDDAEEPDLLPKVLRAVEVDVQRPSSALDEDGYDSECEWWSDSESYRCNFAVARVGDRLDGREHNQMPERANG